MREGSPDSDRSSSRSSGSADPKVQHIPNPLFEARDRRNPLGRAFGIEMAHVGKDRGSSGSVSLSSGDFKDAEEAAQAGPTQVSEEEAQAIRELMKEPFGQCLERFDLKADVLIDHGWRLKDVKVLRRWFRLHNSLQHTLSVENVSSLFDRGVMWLFGLREGAILYDEATLRASSVFQGDRVFLRGSGVPIRSEPERRRLLRVELFRQSFWRSLMALIHVVYIVSAVRQFVFVGSTNPGVLVQTYSNSERATLIEAFHTAFRNTFAFVGTTCGLMTLPLVYGLLEMVLYVEQYVHASADRMRHRMTRLHLPTSFTVWRNVVRYWLPLNSRAVDLNVLNRMTLFSKLDPEQRNYLTDRLSALLKKVGGHEATLLLTLMSRVAAMSPEDATTLLNSKEISVDERESIVRACVWALCGLMETGDDPSASLWKREQARRAMWRSGALDLSRRDHQVRFVVYTLLRVLLLGFAGLNLYELGRVVVDVVRCPRANHDTTPLGTLPYGVSFGIDCFRNMMDLYGLIPNQPAGPVADMIRMTHFSQRVSSLKLPGKLVSAQGAAALLDAFADRAQYLDEVDLSDNDFRDPSAIGAFHRALQRHPVVVLTLAQTGDTVPRTEAASLALVKCARGIPTLREWRLGGLTGNATVVQALSDTLQTTDLRVLHVSNSTAGFGTVTNATANTFGAALASNPDLEDVAFEAWTAMDAGNAMIWGLERAVPHLPVLTRFSLSGNNFGSTRHKTAAQADEDWSTLGRMLPDMRQLHVLDVSWNVNAGFTPPVAGPRLFFASLGTSGMDRLEELHLSSNLLSPQCYEGLRTTFPGLPNLKTLDMTGLDIGLFPDQSFAAVDAIFTGLRGHPRLETLLMGANIFGLAPYNGTLVCESLGSLGGTLAVLDVSLNAFFDNRLPLADLPSCLKGGLYHLLCARSSALRSLDLRGNLIGEKVGDWSNITKALATCSGIKQVAFQSQSDALNRFRPGDVRVVETYLAEHFVESDGVRATFASPKDVEVYFDDLPASTQSVSFHGTIFDASPLQAIWHAVAERPKISALVMDSPSLIQISQYVGLKNCSQLATLRLRLSWPTGEILQQDQSRTVESSSQIINALATMLNVTDLELLFWPSSFPVERIESLTERLAQVLEVMCPSLRSLVLYNFATSGPSFERLARALERCVNLRTLGLPYSSFPRNATHLPLFERALSRMRMLETLNLGHTPIGDVPGATEALVEVVRSSLHQLTSASFDESSIGRHGPSGPSALLRLAGERPGFSLSAQGGSWQGINWGLVAAPVVLQREGGRVRKACEQSLCYAAVVPSANATGLVSGLQFSALPEHRAMDWEKSENTVVTVAGAAAGGLLALTVGVAVVVTRRRCKRLPNATSRARKQEGRCYQRRTSLCERLLAVLSAGVTSWSSLLPLSETSTAPSTHGITSPQVVPPSAPPIVDACPSTERVLYSKSSF